MDLIWVADRGESFCQDIAEHGGKVYTCGDARQIENVVERWDSDGNLEQNYNRYSPHPSPYAVATRYSMIWDSSDRLIVSGNDSPYSYGLYRYNYDGTLDTMLGNTFISSFVTIGTDGYYYVMLGSLYQGGGSGWMRIPPSGIPPSTFTPIWTGSFFNNSYGWGLDIYNNVWASFFGDLSLGLSVPRIRKWTSGGTLLWEKVYSQLVEGSPGNMTPDDAGGMYVCFSNKCYHLNSAGGLVKTMGVPGATRVRRMPNGDTYWLSGGVWKFDISDNLVWKRFGYGPDPDHPPTPAWGMTAGGYPDNLYVTDDNIYLCGSRTRNG